FSCSVPPRERHGARHGGYKRRVPSTPPHARYLTPRGTYPTTPSRNSTSESSKVMRPRDRGGREQVPDGEALRQLAGRLPAAAREQPDDEEARPPEGEEPGGHRVADGGPGRGADPVAAGVVLPADQEPDRRPGGGHGDGPRAGPAGVPDAQVRRGVRQAVDGGVRGEAAGQVGTAAPCEGSQDGLRAGAPVCGGSLIG